MSLGGGWIAGEVEGLVVSMPLVEVSAQSRVMQSGLSLAMGICAPPANVVVSEVLLDFATANELDTVAPNPLLEVVSNS